MTADRKTHKRRSDCKRNDDFMAEVKATINEDPSKSMGQLAKEFNVGKATIHRAVHVDLGYQSFVLRRRQLLTEATQERRKLRVQALLNDLKRDSAGLLRFFSDEKFVIHDGNMNRQNDRWLCDDPSEVSTVMHTTCPSSVIVLGVVSCEGHIMPPYFFPQGLRINADAYIDVLRTVVKPWMDKVARRREYVFQQDSACSQGSEDAGMVFREPPAPLAPDLWAPSSLDCNPLDYFVWRVVEAAGQQDVLQHRGSAEGRHL